MQPTPGQVADAVAFWVNKHVKSNGIPCARAGNAGHRRRITSRIWAAEHALGGAAKPRGVPMASDAFPVPDCVEAANKAGIAIIQPGGSKGDEASIKACDAHGISMIFTGMRHFKRDRRDRR